MEYNFTPLDIVKFKQTKVENKKSDATWIVFLLLGIITLFVVAALLFILIQKKLQATVYIPHQTFMSMSHKVLLYG